ncbi:carbon-nitrogen hydrolase family protein [Lacticaseibacillus absianus]|uniref:carbon-nitrogen hydrolase family protein n=1 Tax=Lacticaseibacillus absianus TaxID=2729623 RepID=UPI0015C7A06A|nr:carbon-nitrogen hydrolase family protein [Lacticaseibacillus absianus]
MRCALTAAPSLNGALSLNRQTLHRFVRANAGCDFVCFGEAFLQGFDGLTWAPLTDLSRGLALDGPELQALAAYARAQATGIATGYIERDGDTLYSSYLVLDRTGRRLANYRRITPGWREGHVDRTVYREGTQPVAFDYAGHRIGIGLCGDFWDAPATFAALSADVTLWPLYISYTPAEWAAGGAAEYAAQAAKVSAHVLMINALTPGDAYGGSCAFKAGQRVAGLPMGEPGTLVVTLPDVPA